MQQTYIVTYNFPFSWLPCAKKVSFCCTNLMQYPRPAYVAADLAVTPLKEALVDKGFNPSKPALFTCEGILCYLPQVRTCPPHANASRAAAARMQLQGFAVSCKDAKASQTAGLDLKSAQPMSISKFY